MRLLAMVAVVTAAAVAFSGCTFSNGADGQSASASGKNSFSLSGNGYGTVKRETEFENALSRVEYSAGTNLGDGSVTFTIKDAKGVGVASFTLSGTGQKAKSGKSNAGEPGTWTVVAQGRDASGQFHISGHGVD